MKAAFMTEGRTMTHSALSRRSAGISSGTLRISTITVPAFLMRLFSSFCADAGTPAKAITTRNDRILFIDVLLYNHHGISTSSSSVTYVTQSCALHKTLDCAI